MAARWTESLDCLSAIEAELTPTQFRALREGLRVAGLQVDGWLAIPAWTQVWAGLAARNLYEREVAAGRTQDEALATVHCRLGIPGETVRTWWARWRRRAA